MPKTSSPIKFQRKFLPSHVQTKHYDVPEELSVLEASTFVPQKLLDVEKACQHPEIVTGDVAIHFYRWDYVLSRKRYTPEALMSVLPRGTCLLSPDFSMFRDMFPDEIKWNWYRAHDYALRMLKCGFRLVPSLSWAEEDTLEYCFKFIQPGGTIAVSTIGIKNDAWANILFNIGMEKAIQVLHPSCIIVYGGKLDFDFGNIPVRRFSNTSFQWTRNWRSREA